MHNAESVAALQQQMYAAYGVWLDAKANEKKALKEYNRLFDEILILEMRAKRGAQFDGR